MQIALILLALVVALMLFILIMVHVGFSAPRIRETATPAQFGLEFESVSIPGVDQATLFGWWLPLEQARESIILLHGWGGNMEMMLPLARPFLRLGLNVLLIDSRNHGQSDGGVVSSMPRFAEDVDCAINWLKTQRPAQCQRLALLGHSVGAAAVLPARISHQNDGFSLAL